MTDLKLSVPNPFIKGCVVEGISIAQVDGLTVDFATCWNTVYALNARLASNLSVLIVIEIWPDTGRVFWISISKRELFRLELKVPSIEAIYFDILNASSFDNRYGELVALLTGQVRASFTAPSAEVNRVIVRDSDDSNSEQVIYCAE